MDNTLNPAGLDGFAFLEFSSPSSEVLTEQFYNLGFTKVGQHKEKNIELFHQGNIFFLLNKEVGLQADNHARMHGPGACSMGFSVKSAKKALEHVLDRGAKQFLQTDLLISNDTPAIDAIGGSVIYFIEDLQAFLKDNFEYRLDNAKEPLLIDIDHLTHNVYKGNLDLWANFYVKLFNFSEIRFFDIQGQQTGLISRAMQSPCTKIKIPLNESTDDKSQIEEFLTEYHGEGIQHIALTSPDIYRTVETLKNREINFLDVPDTYYEMISERIDWHKEDLERLQKNKILIDGGKTAEEGLLLQIFTQNMLGPAFFEIIQRKGHPGFGEGNFQALFESIERDQIRRGILNKSTS